MDLLYLLGWYYQGEDGEEDARDFFNQLREKKSEFPFSCSYQVGLVHCSEDEHWAVGVLVMRGTAEDDSVEQMDKLQKWFDKSGANNSGTDKRVERVIAPSVEGTLQGRYGNHYRCVELFGTL